MNPILCLAHNNLALTRKAIASFLVQDVPVEVLLINNASTDGTASWMATLDKRVTQVHLREQQSVAAAWNYGLRWCFKAGADKVLVCNNDVEIGPETYGYLSAVCDLETQQRIADGYVNSFQFVTCVSVNKKEQNIHPALGWSYHVRPHPDFSCFMIHRYVTETIGWFDEEYKIAYGEDCDYHVRMHRGGINAMCFDIPFLHHGASTVKLADPEEVERICEQAERNRERFYAKYGVRIGTPEYDTLFTPETFGIDLPIKPDKLLV